MLMASGLLYEMARQAVLPPFLGKAHRTRRTPYAANPYTTALPLAVIVYVARPAATPWRYSAGRRPCCRRLHIVNICVGSCARGRSTGTGCAPTSTSTRNDEEPEISPNHLWTVLLVIGPLACAFLVTPLSGGRGSSTSLPRLPARPGHRALGGDVIREPGAAGPEGLSARPVGPGGVSG
jgi:hypothetical protein